MAVNAKARHKILDEIKKDPKKRSKLESIIVIKEEMLPDEVCEYVKKGIVKIVVL